MATSPRRFGDARAPRSKLAPKRTPSPTSASQPTRAELEHELRRGLVAISLEVEATQVKQLIDYVELLQKWSRVYNLTAIRDPLSILTQHLFDCLAVVRPIETRCGPDRALHLADIGCGAGLPSVVLAIMRPDWSIDAVDTVEKKVSFVRQAAASLKCPNLRAHHERVEQIQGWQADLVCSRAFASLRDFATWSGHLVADQGYLMAMKGVQPLDELAELPAPWRSVAVEPLHVPRLDAARHLVWLQADDHNGN